MEMNTFDNKPHGQGTWANGDKYIGQWKNGLLDGIGKRTYADQN